MVAIRGDVENDMTTNGATSNGTMTNSAHPNGADIIDLNLIINDSDLCSELAGYTEGKERDDFAISAMKICVIALRQAQAG